MRKLGDLITPALALVVLAFYGCGTQAATDDQDFPEIERGRYLTILGDCAACHTMPGSEHDFAGGRPIETPFGKILAPNITPDRETGIGAWSDDEFVSALTQGTGRDGAHLYPAMPYTYLTRVTREDALAIRSYLSTVPAVPNAVISNQLPFPFNQRVSMVAWNALFFTPGIFRPVNGKSAEWNRGAYLAEGLMHCGMCHTPKNVLGGDKTAQRLQGYALQGWFAPDITPDNRRGIGGWSADDIVAYLKTGHNRTAAASGPMGEEVSLSSSRLTDADLHAIAVYLKDQPNRDHADEATVAADDGVMKVGAAIYADECSACHTPKGTGIAELFPALAEAPSVQSTDPTSLIRVVLRGARSVATNEAPTGPAMPSFAWLLNDEQVASVTTYIRNAWGNASPAVTASQVAATREALSLRSD
jgi:mono/diheme cytochrome c family protein